MPTVSSLHCRLLAASAAAYSIDVHGRYAPIEAWHRAAGFVAAPTPITGGPRHIDGALVGPTADGVVVAFRGTLSGAANLRTGLDWFQDLRAEPVGQPGFPGKVHRGFHGAWARVEEGVMAAVRDQLRPGGRLYVTGHSKGGSMASLGAWALQEAGLPPTEVVTFAAALVGDAAFASLYDAVFTQVRYENHLDLVPFVPPTPTLAEALDHIPLVGRLFEADGRWSYTHVGRLRHLTADGAVIGDEPGLAELRVAQIAASVGRDEGAEVLAAHSLSGGYCRAVCPPGTCPAGDADA